MIKWKGSVGVEISGEKVAFTGRGPVAVSAAMKHNLKKRGLAQETEDGKVFYSARVKVWLKDGSTVDLPSSGVVGNLRLTDIKNAEAFDELP